MSELAHGKCVERQTRSVARRGLPRHLIACTLLCSLGLVSPAASQSPVPVGNNSGVVINTDVLNSLGAGRTVPLLNPQPGHPNSSYARSGPSGLLLTRPATLLFPPPSNPVSRLAQDRGLTPAPSLIAPQATTIIGGQTSTAATSDAPESRLLIPPTPAAPAAPAFSTPSATALLAPPAAAPAPTVAVVTAPAPQPLKSTPVPVQPQVVQPQVVQPQVVQPQVVQPQVVQPQVVQPQVVASDPDDTPTPETETAEAPPAVPETTTAAVQPAIPFPPAKTEGTANESADLPQPPPVPEASEPQVASEAASESAPQSAALPPAGTQDGEVTASILFAKGSADLTDEGRAELKALADDMSRDESLRVQLLAFAGSDGSSSNVARRLSLSRALVVRGFLIDQGISSTRMQVRALGDRSEGGPEDRVDIKPQGG